MIVMITAVIHTSATHITRATSQSFFVVIASFGK